MKVAIAHKDPAAVDALRRLAVSMKRTVVTWIAYDGAEAVRSCKEEPPDLLLLGLELPSLDGIAATKQIMADSPCAVIVVAPAARGLSSKVYDAMGAGAVDVVELPSTEGGELGGTTKILEKLMMVRKLVGSEALKEASRSVRQTPAEKLPTLIALGASTGGPQALAAVLAAFPSDLDVAIVVVQHFDRLYAQGFVDWLAPQCKMPVRLVSEGAGPKTGMILIGATNDHLVMDSSWALAYTPHPREKPYRPSVDVFFESAARHWPKPSVAAVLTGMGRDGAQGLLALRRAGWFTVAQDEQSSVVYGMPKACVEVGAAMRVLPLHEIGAALLSRVRKRRPA